MSDLEDLLGKVQQQAEANAILLDIVATQTDQIYELTEELKSVREQVAILTEIAFADTPAAKQLNGHEAA